MNNDLKIKKEIDIFLQQFTDIKINGFKICCPYWSNKLKDGKVMLSGFLGGKGDSGRITQEIVRLYGLNKDILRTVDDLYALLKRNRIGLDCSGFVFQLLDKLIKLKYRNSSLENILELYPQGINRTNSDSLTSSSHLVKIIKLSELQLGDLIRLIGGKHIMIITANKAGEITYVHSSKLTQINGVHFGNIKILRPREGLADQLWKEKTKTGENFGDKFFDAKNGDGIFRLKIFS